MHRDRLTPGCPGEAVYSQDKAFHRAWGQEQAIMDERKDLPGPGEVAEKTGLGGSGSHWTPTQLQLVPSSGKKGLVASLGKPWSMQLTGSQLQKGGEARRSGETTFTTPDLLRLGLGGLCPCIVSANSAPFLIHGGCLACVFQSTIAFIIIWKSVPE